MATITGMTAAAMNAIAEECIISGTVNGSGHLILTKQDLSTIDAGNVKGATGATGPAGANGTNGTDGSTASLDYLSTHNPTAGDVSLNTHKLTNVTNGSSAQDAATFGQVMLKAGGTFTGAIVQAAVTLTYATTIAVNAALGNTFRVTLTGLTAALGLPTNPVDNQKVIFEVTQDATGSRALTYNAVYEFTTALPAPTLSTAANTTDYLVFIYNSTAAKWRYMGALLGYT